MAWRMAKTQVPQLGRKRLAYWSPGGQDEGGPIMRWKSVRRRLCALGLMATVGNTLAWAAPPIDLQRDGGLTMAGRTLRCGSVRNVLDPRLPNLGLAARGVVVFNPRLLGRHTDTVRLFVFHHECGHHHVGGSETGADCWATKRGLQDGWLDRKGLVEVCRSFGNAPATRTHPSGASRCASLQQCFVTAAATRAKQVASRATIGKSAPSAAAPKLVFGPALVRDGLQRAVQYAGRWR